MLNAITNVVTLLSKVGEKKVTASQSVKEAVTIKTNLAASGVIAFCLTQLAANPSDKFYQGMFAVSVIVITLRDTAEKILKALKELKGVKKNG